jgi:hypothetical protein
VNTGAARDGGQRDRRDTGLDGQGTCGFDQGRRTSALVLLGAGALKRELRHAPEDNARYVICITHGM